jgi:hypothetical protein
MNLDQSLKILLPTGTLAAGAALTALRSKLASTKQKNVLHWIFYIVSGLLFLGTVVAMLVFWKEIFQPDWFAIIVCAIAVASSIGLFWSTKRFLLGKNQFTTDELDPVINDFTRNADKANIKLLAGNLDFLGTSRDEMNKQLQYRCLLEEKFKHIEILCLPPADNADKIRYGKILVDFPVVELRYYDPGQADLNVRGRIKTLNGVTRLLIYNKVSPRVYQALELDTADRNGAHFTRLWDLVWTVAHRPTGGQLHEYRQLYQSPN